MMMSRLLKITVSGTAVAAAIGFVAIFIAGPSLADNKQDDSRGGDDRRYNDSDIIWNPPTLNFSVKPGETASLPAIFTARERIEGGAVVYASTSLKTIVSVTPTTLGSLGKGQT